MECEGLAGHGEFGGAELVFAVVAEDDVAEFVQEFRREVGHRVVLALRLDLTLLDKEESFHNASIQALRRAEAAGFCAVKFWFSPRYTVESKVYLDSEPLRPIFETMEELGLPALVHVADPDLWFQTNYADAKRYGTKAEHLKTLENVLSRHRSLRVVGAHMAASPEDLGYLDDLLDKHSNLYLAITI